MNAEWKTMLESFPLDTYWCETRVEEQIENSIVRNSDSIHSLRIKLKRHNRHLRKELRILKKVESLLQDQASKLEAFTEGCFNNSSTSAMARLHLAELHWLGSFSGELYLIQFEKRLIKNHQFISWRQYNFNSSWLWTEVCYAHSTYPLLCFVISLWCLTSVTSWLNLIYLTCKLPK